MTYVLAKYTLLFLLVSLSAFLFGRWMTKRNFVDISESDEDLREASGRSDEAEWNRLWSRLDKNAQLKASNSDAPLEKDDLSHIWGIGPHLESRLNKNGIFYFWQIADWTAQDIRQINDRLDTFKGRIDRDNWVSQAAQFSAEPGSARRLAAVQKTA